MKKRIYVADAVTLFLARASCFLIWKWFCNTQEENRRTKRKLRLGLLSPFLDDLIALIFERAGMI
jgi:hypothetical protein